MTTEQAGGFQTRRPLPALIFIAALVVLAAIVWLRVLHTGAGTRPHQHKAALPPCPSTSPTPATSPSLPALTSLPFPRDVHVVVLNSTNRSGLAASTAHALDRDGFSIALVTDDAKKYGGHGLISGVAEIRYGPAGRAAAELLSYYLPQAALVPSAASPARTSPAGTSSTVTLSLGQRFHALVAAKTVRAQLKTAGVTLHRPRPAPAPTTPATRPAGPSPAASASCAPAHR